MLVGDQHITRGSIFTIGGALGLGKSRPAVALSEAGAIGGFAFCNPRSDCFRLEQQLPGGFASSNWIIEPFHGAREMRANS